MEKDIITICRKKAIKLVLEKKVKDLDKSKLSNMFKSNNFDQNMNVYVQCNEDGSIYYRKRKTGLEYRIYPVDLKKVKRWEEWIGEKVVKHSKKPFKSTLQVNTVKGITINPNTNKKAFSFHEDDSLVDCCMCFFKDYDEIL